MSERFIGARCPGRRGALRMGGSPEIACFGLLFGYGQPRGGELRSVKSWGHQPACGRVLKGGLPVLASAGRDRSPAVRDSGVKPLSYRRDVCRGRGMHSASASILFSRQTYLTASVECPRRARPFDMTILSPGAVDWSKSRRDTRRGGFGEGRCGAARAWACRRGPPMAALDTDPTRRSAASCPKGGSLSLSGGRTA